MYIYIYIHTYIYTYRPPDEVGTAARALGLDVEVPRRITRIIIKLRAVPRGKVLNLRTTTSQKCEAVPRRARI